MTHGMKGSLFTCLTTLLLIGFAAVAESQGMMGGGGMGMMGGSSGSMVRHHQFMMGGVPEPYRLLTNPLPIMPRSSPADERSIRTIALPVTVRRVWVMGRLGANYRRDPPIWHGSHVCR